MLYLLLLGFSQVGSTQKYTIDKVWNITDLPSSVGRLTKKFALPAFQQQSAILPLEPYFSYQTRKRHKLSRTRWTESPPFFRHDFFVLLLWICKVKSNWLTRADVTEIILVAHFRRSFSWRVKQVPTKPRMLLQAGTLTNRSFARSGHMVRNKLCWNANNAVGLPKQRKVGLDW